MADDPEKTSDSPNHRPTPAGSVSERDWTLWAARSLFILAFAPATVIAYYAVQLELDEEIDFTNLGSRVISWGIASVCLGTASGVLYGLRQVMRERRFPTPSGADYEKVDVTKKPFAMMMDHLSTIAGVVYFVFVAMLLFNTRPILAAVCLSIAILWPALFGSWRRR